MKINRKKLPFMKKDLLYIIPSIIAIISFIVMVYFLIEFMMIIGKNNSYSLENKYNEVASFLNKTATPIITFIAAICAFLAFRAQKDQLNQQKEDSTNQRIESTFFQLLNINHSLVNHLEYENPEEQTNSIGSGFFKKTYTDLIHIYNENEGSDEQRLQHAMEQLDSLHKNNFHLYYKNLFQLFNWIHTHRAELSKEQQEMYVDLIRAQLSHYQMMLIYFNAKFFGRNYFYKVLKDLGFLEKYNRDGYESIEEKFVAEANAYQAKEIIPQTPVKQAESNQYTYEELLRAFQEEELEVQYQPIISATNLQIIGTEALLRWRHPNKGMILPKHFISQMDKDFSKELLDFLISQVCQAIKQNKNNMKYSINISINQLLLSDFLHTIDNICTRYKVNINQIQFEITESQELYQYKQIKNIIAALRNMGYKVGLDDFGDGFFSFQSLIDLEVDFIKLDKQFVSKLNDDPHVEQTIEHIIHIMKLQNNDIIVEGIETVHQLETWRKLGAHELQGYFIHESVPKQQLKKLNAIIHKRLRNAAL